MNNYLSHIGVSTLIAIVSFLVATSVSTVVGPVGDSAVSNLAHSADNAQDFGGVRLVLASEGNTARFLVREQLAGFDFPNDAVGETNDVTGVVVFNADGEVVVDESNFVVDITGLESDSGRRDGYIRRNTLETETYPTVTLAPLQTRGLTFPLPESGSGTFDIVGNLTIKEVTQPTSWRVTAQFDDGVMTGTARTEFTFEEFGMEKPSVGAVLSVADAIRLEFDFTMNVEYVSVQ